MSKINETTMVHGKAFNGSSIVRQMFAWAVSVTNNSPLLNFYLDNCNQIGWVVQTRWYRLGGTG